MKTVKLDRFRGINNRLPLERLRVLGDRAAGAFVHDAANVDLTDAGSFQRRPGYTRVGTDENCRGLFSAGNIGYYVSDDQIRRLDASGQATTIGTVASAYAPIACVATPRGVVMSDTFTLRLLSGANAQRLAPPQLNAVPLVSVIAGALPAGSYSMLFMLQDADGVRSAPSVPIDLLDLPEGSALQIAAPARAHTMLVFLTAVDGEVFYRVGELAPAATSLTISANTADQESFVYAVHAELMAGDVMGYHKGRLFSARQGVAAYSLPFQYALHRPAVDYLLFPSDVTLFASVDEGLFIGTADATYFMPGGDPAKERMEEVFPFGAVRGSLTQIPNSDDWTWFSPRGPVRTEGGKLVLLQDENIAFGQAERGASVVREQNGLRALISSLAGASPSAGAVVGSYMDAEVITGVSP